MNKQNWLQLSENIAGKVSERWPDIPQINQPTPGGQVQPSGATASGATVGDTVFIYSGLKQEIVPQRLLLDSRLTPLERNGWLVFKMLLDKEGYSVPRYQDLQPYLAQIPYGEQASRETISRVIAILRMTRWVSLLAQGRDSDTGRIVGNMYILHEEPVTVQEAEMIDPGYAELVTKNLHHSIKSVRIVAEKTIDEMANAGTIPTRLEVLQQRIEASAGAITQSTPRTSSESERSKITLVRNPNPAKKPSSEPSSESELSEKSPVRNISHPSSDFEPGRKATEINAVRNPNYSTSTVLNTYTCTVLYRDAEGKTHNSSLQWPEHLDDHIPVDERRQALAMLEYQNPGTQQELVNELAARCQQGGIKKPLGYLRGLVRKAEQGKFNLWSGQDNPATDQPATAATHTGNSKTSPPPSAPSIADFNRVPIDQLSPEGKASYLAVTSMLGNMKSSRQQNSSNRTPEN